MAQRRRRRDPAEAHKRNSVMRRCGAYPGLLVPRLDSGRSCDEAKGVREVGNPPAARNQGGGRVTCSGGSKGNSRVWRGVEC